MKIRKYDGQHYVNDIDSYQWESFCKYFFYKNTDGNWLLSNEVISKIPEELGMGKHNRHGVGYRWSDGKQGNDLIRIDKGNSQLKNPAQQIDHVRINKEGKVIGRDGNPIAPSKDILNPASHPDSHIPLEEWIKWKSWYKL